MGELISLFTSPGFILVALIGLLLVSRGLGYRVEWGADHRIPALTYASKRDEAQLAVAFDRIADTGKGLRGVVDADRASFDDALERWFVSLCTSAAWTLATNNAERYRVAIWTTDSEDPTILRALAWHLFDPNDEAWLITARRPPKVGRKPRSHAPNLVLVPSSTLISTKSSRDIPS